MLLSASQEYTCGRTDQEGCTFLFQWFLNFPAFCVLLVAPFVNSRASEKFLLYNREDHEIQAQLESKHLT